MLKLSLTGKKKCVCFKLPLKKQYLILFFGNSVKFVKYLQCDDPSNTSLIQQVCAHYVGLAAGPGIHSCEFETDHSSGTYS